MGDGHNPPAFLLRFLITKACYPVRVIGEGSRVRTVRAFYRDYFIDLENGLPARGSV
jgi:hypothetical protein